MTIKDYDSIADELDDLLINHAKIIQKRNRHKDQDIYIILESWSLGISIRGIEIEV